MLQNQIPVGVGPRGFYGTTIGERPLVFVPITFRWLPEAWMFPQHADRKSYWAYLFARLKPGVSLEQARAALDVRASLLARDYPETHKDVRLRVIPETHARPNPQLGAVLRVASTVLAGSPPCWS